MTKPDAPPTLAEQLDELDLDLAALLDGLDLDPTALLAELDDTLNRMDR